MLVKTKDRESLPEQEPVSLPIMEPLLRFMMNRPVHLNYQPGFKAGEIDDVAANRQLTSELPSVQSLRPEFAPHCLLK